MVSAELLPDVPKSMSCTSVQIQLFECGPLQKTVNHIHVDDIVSVDKI